MKKLNETTQEDLLQYEITGHALATVLEVFQVDGIMVDHYNEKYVIIMEEDLVKFFYWDDVKDAFPGIEFVHGHVIHLVEQGAGDNTIQ